MFCSEAWVLIFFSIISRIVGLYGIKYPPYLDESTYSHQRDLFWLEQLTSAIETGKKERSNGLCAASPGEKVSWPLKRTWSSTLG